MYLADKKPQDFLKRFAKVWTEKLEAIVGDVSNRHLYLSDFQILSGEIKQQWQ